LPILYSIKDANVNRQHNLTEQITEQTTKQNKTPENPRSKLFLLVDKIWRRT